MSQSMRSEIRARRRLAARRSRERRRRALTGLALGLLVLVTVFSVSGFANMTKPAVYKYYDAVVVTREDTLWTIAESHITAPCGSMRSYMKEIRALNHMKGDTVYCGQTLVVPYYAETPRKG